MIACPNYLKFTSKLLEAKKIIIFTTDSVRSNTASELMEEIR